MLVDLAARELDERRAIGRAVLGMRDVRERDELLRVIVDALPALVCYVDRDLRYRLFNRAYER